MSRFVRNIALDARVAQASHAGVASYARSLIPHLSMIEDASWLFVVDKSLPFDHIAFPKNSRLLFTSVGRDSWARRDIWEQTILPRTLAMNEAALYHGLDYIVPIVRTPFAKVATFHDAIVFSEHDDRSSVARARARFLFKRIASSADAIVTDSEYSARELLRHLPALTGKLETVWAGIDDSFFTPADPDAISRVSKSIRTDSFVLYFGGFSRRKNVHLLLQAFATLQLSKDLKLVLVGPRGDAADRLQLEAESLGIGDRVHLYGPAPQDELKALLSCCSLFAFPSDTEGFGLPVAEAMAVGAPVVCSPNGSLPEIAGEGALLVETRVEPFAAAMQMVLGDPEVRRRLVRRGRDRSELFRWSRSVGLLQRTYERAISSVVVSAN